jgi:hypothetical protein
MSDQVVEEIGAADCVDVVIGLRPQLVLDLPADVMALLLHCPCGRACIVEIEVDLGVLADPELGEQVVDHRTAVGIQDLALDRADAEMLERRVHLGRHLGEPLVHHRLHALQQALRAEGTDSLDLVGEDGVLEGDMRYHEGAGLPRVVGVLDRGCPSGRGLDQVEAALLLFDHDRGGGHTLLPEQTELTDPARDVGHLVDGVGERHHGEGVAGEDVQGGHRQSPSIVWIRKSPLISGR